MAKTKTSHFKEKKKNTGSDQTESELQEDFKKFKKVVEKLSEVLKEMDEEAKESIEMIK